jgi:hypothetical protein
MDDDAIPDGCAVLEDIRIAEAQIGRGEGVEHDAAREQVRNRLLRTGS